MAGDGGAVRIVMDGINLIYEMKINRRKSFKLRSIVWAMLILLALVLRIFGLRRSIYDPVVMTIALAGVFDGFYYWYRYQRKPKYDLQSNPEKSEAHLNERIGTNW